MARKISVLVVDDSAFMRKALKRMLDSDPMIHVIGDASDGEEAIEKVIELKPDVITLDVKMPGMDGLIALKAIMKNNPTPVLMISSLTSEGGGTTLEALEAGAVDFIDKSSCHTTMDILDIADSLVEKVKTLAGVDLSKVVSVKPRPVEKRPVPSVKPMTATEGMPTHIVAIGASTGGPMSLEKVLTALPGNYSGALMVVQHMPVGFTRSLAERLDQQCHMIVKEAQEDDLILPGMVFIAPAGYHLIMKRNGDKFNVALSRTPRDTLHCPSVDVLFKSVAETWPGKMMGVIMTGMGQDGTEGIKVMKQRGATVLAQNEATCVVFGMPKAAKLSGNVDRMVPLFGIANEIISFP